MAKGYVQNVEVVDFYNKPIITAYSDGIGYVVPMKHIVEDHLGLQWEKQRVKINTSTTLKDGSGEEYEANLFNPVVVSGYDLVNGITTQLEHNYPDEDIPQFLPNQDYTCLPVEELNLFLAQINLSRVNVEVRENLYHYQKECGAALHDYWFRGMAVNSRKDPSRISSARHDWCPRELSTRSLLKGCTRYSAYAERNFDVRIDPADIETYAKNSIAAILDIESDQWENEDGVVVYILSFLERAAFDIIYFSIENNVSPENLQETLDTNLLNAWEHMGTLIVSVQAPFSAFPGVGRGLPRELI